MIKIIPLFLLFFSTILGADPLKVIYMAQAGYDPRDVEERSREFFMETGIGIDLHFEEYEAIYDIVTDQENDFDVVLLDNIWTADFAHRGILEPVPASIRSHIENNIIPEIYNANAYGDELWAVPFLANFQLLYTNKDLLEQAGYSEPPSTLDELYEMALKAKTDGIIEYPIFDSLRSQEILVCELVWLSGIEGTSWDTTSGRFLVDRPELRRSVEYLLELKQNGLLNPFSLNAGELFSAEVFTWGDALFSTNWTFLIGELQESVNLDLAPPQFETVVSVLPSYSDFSRSNTISGFQGLAVLEKSEQKDKAWQFITYLSSPDFQRQHLDEFPVWKELWEEENISIIDPHFEVKRLQVEGAKARPVHPRYQEISAIIQTWVHHALREEMTVDQAFRSMQTAIDSLGL